MSADRVRRAVRAERQGLVPLGPRPARGPGDRRGRRDDRRGGAAAARRRRRDRPRRRSRRAASSGLDDVFRVNGPAGIAAMAFGTESIPKVRLVVGPGSPAVTCAQLEVQRYGTVTTMVLGPTESLVIADETADVTPPRGGPPERGGARQRLDDAARDDVARRCSTPSSTRSPASWRRSPSRGGPTRRRDRRATAAPSSCSDLARGRRGRERLRARAPAARRARRRDASSPPRHTPARSSSASRRRSRPRTTCSAVPRRCRRAGSRRSRAASRRDTFRKRTAVAPLDRDGAATRHAARSSRSRATRASRRTRRR